MSNVRFDPMRGFETAMRRVNDFMGDLDKGFNIEYGSFAPRVDISEDEKNLFFHVELPGLAKEDVKVTVNEEKILMIKGEKKHEIKEEDKANDKSYIRVERTYGSFTRTFQLPETVKSDSVTAKFDNGLLTLTLEKTEPKKPKEIEIALS